MAARAIGAADLRTKCCRRRQRWGRPVPRPCGGPGEQVHQTAVAQRAGRRPAARPSSCRLHPWRMPGLAAHMALPRRRGARERAAHARKAPGDQCAETARTAAARALRGRPGPSPSERPSRQPAAGKHVAGRTQGPHPQGPPKGPARGPAANRPCVAAAALAAGAPGRAAPRLQLLQFTEHAGARHRRQRRAVVLRAPAAVAAAASGRWCSHSTASAAGRGRVRPRPAHGPRTAPAGSTRGSLGRLGVQGRRRPERQPWRAGGHARPGRTALAKARGGGLRHAGRRLRARVRQRALPQHARRARVRPVRQQPRAARAGHGVCRPGAAHRGAGAGVRGGARARRRPRGGKQARRQRGVRRGALRAGADALVGAAAAPARHSLALRRSKLHGRGHRCRLHNSANIRATHLAVAGHAQFVACPAKHANSLHSQDLQALSMAMQTAHPGAHA